MYHCRQTAIWQTDFGPTDSGPTDSGPTDSGPTDYGPTDYGPTDYGPTDFGPTDFGPTDFGPTFFRLNDNLIFFVANLLSVRFVQNQRKVSKFQSFRPFVIIPSFFLHQIITMFTSRMTKILTKVEAHWKRGWNNTKFYSHPLSPISFSCFLFDF